TLGSRFYTLLIRFCRFYAGLQLGVSTALGDPLGFMNCCFGYSSGRSAGGRSLLHLLMITQQIPAHMPIQSKAMMTIMMIHGVLSGPELK
ncbi:hypothetical protein PENTCL1PPCAC_10584, partial [Pristionchus entomophagus]